MKRKRPVLVELDDDSDTLLLPAPSRSRTLKAPAKSYGGEVVCGRSPTPVPSVNRGSSVALLPELRREAGRLIATDGQRQRITLVVATGSKPLTIGRSLSADLTLPEASVSAWHCLVYAFESDAGECLACVEDISTNGIRWNGKLIKRSQIILSHGDTIEMGRKIFVYKHSAPLGGHWDSESSSPLKSSPAQPFVLDHYAVSARILGTGFFSAVHLGFDTRSKAQVAVKIIKKRKAGGGKSASGRKALMSEVELNAKLSHPNINRILEVGEDVEHLYLFMDLQTGGDLYAYIQRRGALDGAAAKWIIYSILLGLYYMHDTVGISHRDLKPENVLIGCATDRFPRVLLADFGAARLAEKACASLSGTISYMAPEVLTVNLTGSYSSKKADMWGVGLLTFITITGGHPFEAHQAGAHAFSTRSLCSRLQMDVSAPEDVDIVRNILNAATHPMELRLPVLSGKQQQPQDFVRRLLDPQPASRMSASQALEHPWIGGSRNELEALHVQVMGKAAV